ncbi:MAG: hypothetical protein FWD15_01535 [Alphaproteobacteria bacterium]|nr:hypothetical protein [Alphaproteobacteria bacterium]
MKNGVVKKALLMVIVAAMAIASVGCAESKAKRITQKELDEWGLTFEEVSDIAAARAYISMDDGDPCLKLESVYCEYSGEYLGGNGGRKFGDHKEYEECYQEFIDPIMREYEKIKSKVYQDFEERETDCGTSICWGRATIYLDYIVNSKGKRLYVSERGPDRDYRKAYGGERAYARRIAAQQRALAEATKGVRK